MQIRLAVKTPPGQAQGTEAKLRLLLLHKLKRPDATYINEAADTFYWVIETDVRRYMKISKNVTMFQLMAGGVIDQMRKREWVKRMGSIIDSDIDTVEAMLKETEVTILKVASADEKLEGETLTFWEKVKKTFKRLGA